MTEQLPRYSSTASAEIKQGEELLHWTDFNVRIHKGQIKVSGVALILF